MSEELKQAISALQCAKRGHCDHAMADEAIAALERALTQRPAAQAGEREAFESRVTLNSIIKQYRIKTEDAHWLRASLPAPQQATPEPVQPRTFDARNAQFREHNWQIRFDAAVDARRLAQERLYSERERHTAEVKRLQLEIGRLTATPEPVGEVVAWWYIEDGEVKFGHPNGHRPTDARPLVFADTHTAPGVPEGWTDADADAARLAMELECLLLDTKDTAAVSRWWTSANEALDLHRARLAAAQAKGADK